MCMHSHSSWTLSGAGLFTADHFVLCFCVPPPPLLFQALLLHNNLIKHAVYDNVGYIIEQEGDSFSVVFHEAEDAVAFTLQVGCVGVRPQQQSSGRG